MSMQSIFEKLIEIVSTYIPLALAKLFHRAGFVKLYQPIPHLSITSGEYAERITGRLEAIQANLDAGMQIGMDIGCNNGFYVFSIAESGMLMFGVEGDDNVFQIFLAAKRKFPLGNVTPVNLHVTPENVIILPECDFVIFMAIFHHWARHYGEDAALKMLSTLLTKTRQTLFFEVPFACDSGENYRNALPDRNAADPEAWWREWFIGEGWLGMDPIYQKGRTLYCIERKSRVKPPVPGGCNAS